MINYSNYLKKNSHTIFLFHGVIPKNNFLLRNYTNKHLELKTFKKIIKDLDQNGNCISIDELSAHIIKKEKFPDYSFSITFDDGFENNLSIAAPILLNLKMPFTIYVTSDFSEKNEMSWTDKIEYAFEHTKEKRLILPWSKKEVCIINIDQKIQIIDEIRDKVKKSKKIDPTKFSNYILEKLKIKNIHKDKFLDQKINSKQIRIFSKDKLICFGAHTKTHKVLSHLKLKELEKEIKTSIDFLKKKCGLEVKNFSYPEGFKGSYNKKVIEVLKKFGIVSSPTAIKGTNTINTSLFNLKRIMVT